MGGGGEGEGRLTIFLLLAPAAADHLTTLTY
jgi:hypothetical protein